MFRMGTTKSPSTSQREKSLPHLKVVEGFSIGEKKSEGQTGASDKATVGERTVKCPWKVGEKCNIDLKACEAEKYKCIRLLEKEYLIKRITFLDY